MEPFGLRYWIEIAGCPREHEEWFATPEERANCQEARETEGANCFSLWRDINVQFATAKEA